MQIGLSCNPTNHSPPPPATPSNHSALANNALQNQHQAQQETKEVRYQKEQERHELLGILSVSFSLSVYSSTLAGRKAAANYFGQICWLDKFGWHAVTRRWRPKGGEGNYRETREERAHFFFFFCCVFFTWAVFKNNKFCVSIVSLFTGSQMSIWERMRRGRSRVVREREWESDDAWQTWLEEEKCMGKENNTLHNTDNLSGFHHSLSAAHWTQTNGCKQRHAHRRLMALMFTSAITDSSGTGMDKRWPSKVTERVLFTGLGFLSKFSACAFSLIMHPEEDSFPYFIQSVQ